MKLILRSSDNDFIKSISFTKLELNQKVFSELSPSKNKAEAHLITTNERITSCELAKLKLKLKKLNINFSDIYSSNRETILSGKSLRINSTLLNIKKNKNESFLDPLSQKLDVVHKGTVRSGDRISSNGDLIIMGDVNPGAIVSANNNVYVWGKLLGTAFAGENGNKNATIASLWLNPIQLRICEIIAIGPKEKPKNQYPEIAILEDNKIIIKLY
tara:strand:+ start:1032 stop:1676 length:645 start_codon:yes stop_codon:yes gene_type:complete